MSVWNSNIKTSKISSNICLGYITKRNVRIERHCEHLVKRNVVFSLWSSKVSIEEKEAIAQKMLATPRSTIFPGKPLQPVVTTESRLRDFVGNELFLLFEVGTTKLN